MTEDETQPRKRIRNDVTGSGDKYTVYALLKFGKENQLRELINKGHLYFSSKQHLRGNLNENFDDFRYDSLEGASMYESHNSGADITMHLPTGDLSTRALKVVFTGKPVNLPGNISSFYGITDKNLIGDKLNPIDQKMKEFGNHFILIYNYERFIRRVCIALDKLELHHSLGIVEYFDEYNHKGDLHYFHKKSSLSYQNEYRIDLDRQSTKPFTLKIGNLREFATICHSDTLEYLSFCVNADNNTLNVHFLNPTKPRPAL